MSLRPGRAARQYSDRKGVGSPPAACRDAADPAIAGARAEDVGRNCRQIQKLTLASKSDALIMTFNTLQLGRDGALATVTLNRPDKRNALSFELLDELVAALDEL